MRFLIVLAALMIGYLRLDLHGTTVMRNLDIAFLMPVLRIIKPADRKFLIVLLVLMIGYFLLDPHGSTVRDALVFCTIVIFALLDRFTPPSRRRRRWFRGGGRRCGWRR